MKAPTNNGAFTEAEITRFNREHDQRYGFDPFNQGGGYTKKMLPQFKPVGKLDKRMVDKELDKIVWGNQ